MPAPDPLDTLSAEIDAMLEKHAPRIVPEQARPAAPEPGAAASSAGPKTIVLVDDNGDYRQLIKSLLEGSSYKVVEAANGLQALPLILRTPPDLVIADFNMPQMNGYELIQEIRSRFETMRVPIILFTGAPNRQHLKTLDLSISDFLEKPVPNRVLLQSVARALGAPPASAAAPAAGRPDASAAEPPASEPMVVELIASRPGVPRGGAPSPAAANGNGAGLPPAPEAAEAEPAVEEWSAAEDASLQVLENEDKHAPQEEYALERLANDSPLIARVNRILRQAVDAHASDIHIEPQEKHVTVRLRVDGTLKPLCTLPIALHPRLSARVKIMANMVITERRLPQDGQFRVQVEGRKIEFRVSTLPCTHGEKIVLRVLGQSKLGSDLSHLGMTPREHECVARALKSPHGLILVTGPTGSGKTTTLYTMISRLNTPDVNIMTAEDPVEYELPDISQVKVSAAIGLTFEKVLRSFLRQDPDIMLIGEIRDLETAEIAVKASITGHLVFSTLHTNSAPATVVRLTHMGVAPFLVAASVKLVVAQRLVRLLCPACKAPAELADDDMKFLTEEEISRLKQSFRHVGCPSCRQTGYAGRKPVFEVMPLASPEMRRIVCDGRGADLLADQALAEGMTTLRRAAMDCVAEGQASLEDALKIVLGD